MKRESYIQASATIRVREKKLLNKSYLNRIIDAASLEETLRFLLDSDYQTYINSLKRPEDYEIALSERNEAFYKELYSISPDSTPIDLVTLKYLYHNLKVVVKEYVQDEDYSDMYLKVRNLNIDGLKEDIKDEKRLKSDENIYEEVREAIAIYDKTKDPQEIDIYLDNMYYKHLKELAKESEVELFIRYVEDLIDFTNIKTFIRCRNQNRTGEFLNHVLIEGGNIDTKDLVLNLGKEFDENSSFIKSSRVYKYLKQGIEDYKKTHSLSIFEKLMDDYFVELIKDVKQIIFGPEVVFAYSLSNEIETRNLRIILISKLNGLSSEFIRERLRETYV